MSPNNEQDRKLVDTTPRLTRRNFLKFVGAAMLGTAVAGCKSEPTPNPHSNYISLATPTRLPTDIPVEQPTISPESFNTPEPTKHLVGDMLTYVMPGTENDPNAPLWAGIVKGLQVDGNGVLTGYVVEKSDVGELVVPITNVR